MGNFKGGGRGRDQAKRLGGGEGSKAGGVCEWNSDLGATFPISLEKGKNISLGLKKRINARRREAQKAPGRVALAFKRPGVCNVINMATKRLSPG